MIMMLLLLLMLRMKNSGIKWLLMAQAIFLMDGNDCNSGDL